MEEIPSVRDFFANIDDHMVHKNLKKVNATFQWCVGGDGGGDWHMVVADNAYELHEGVHADPTVTFTVSATDYLEIINGRMDGRMAVLRKKMRLDGKRMAAMKMAKFLPQRKAK